MSTLALATLRNLAGTASTSSDNVINGSAKAWVNFNGSGSATIRASYNVSSVTYAATGRYTVNFTNALTDANYSAVATAGAGASSGMTFRAPSTTPTTTAFQIETTNAAQSAYQDAAYVSFAAFR